MSLKENDIISVVGIDYTFDGFGVARFNDQTIFVTNLIIGEEADIKITSVKRNFCLAKIVKITKISPDRIVPVSSNATASGVACFEHLDYKKELEYKKSKVERSFRTIAKLTPTVQDIVGMESPYYYRNKVIMPFGTDNKGRTIFGYYKYKSHEIVEMKENSLEDKRSFIILSNIRVLMDKYKISAYDEKTRTGMIRKVMIRTSHYQDEVMVVIITAKDNVDHLDGLIRELLMMSKDITTIVQNINPRDTNVILGEKSVTKYGKGFISDSLLSLKFNISPKSFYQINVVQTERLYQKAIEIAGLSGKEVVLDAYSGIGTIGLIAAKNSSFVYGVEIVKEAVIDAVENARNNLISNVKYVCDDASSYINSYSKNGKTFDVVFVDPPRKGLDSKFKEALFKMQPSKIVYISCDPGTLARDIGELSSIYTINIVQPFDMFPRTYHVESIVLLELKK